MSVSFPYFGLARERGLDYRRVVLMVELLEANDRGEAGARDQEAAAASLPDDAFHAVIDAYRGEMHRREVACAPSS